MLVLRRLIKRDVFLRQFWTIKSTISDNSWIIFYNKNTQRYACYKNIIHYYLPSISSRMRFQTY